MNKRGVLPMDSYRLAQYAVQVPCYICQEGNNFDAELCRHCHAPMALAHQASTQKVRPHMIAVVGSAGAGKTVYLGMLSDMLSRQNDRLQLLARGAFSISLQQSTITALSQGEFPEKTPCEPERWNWIHCELRSSFFKDGIELILPDLAGETLIEEIDHPQAYPVIREFLAKCSAVMVLIDAADVDGGEHCQDYFAMKIISYLCELDSDRKKGWPSRPISIVLTKADRCEVCFENPTAYAREYTPGLWQQCRERLSQYQFFASGVVGAFAYRKELGGRRAVPLRTEPRGIIQPFEWLVEKITK